MGGAANEKKIKEVVANFLVEWRAKKIMVNQYKLQISRVVEFGGFELERTADWNDNYKHTYILPRSVSTRWNTFQNLTQRQSYNSS